MTAPLPVFKPSGRRPSGRIRGRAEAADGATEFLFAVGCFGVARSVGGTRSRAMCDHFRHTTAVASRRDRRRCGRAARLWRAAGCARAWWVLGVWLVAAWPSLLAAQAPGGPGGSDGERGTGASVGAVPEGSGPVASPRSSQKLLQRLDGLLGRPVRRAFVPVAEPRAWPPGSWTPVPTDRFLQALQKLPSPTSGPSGSPIHAAIYVLQWQEVEATAVLGHFAWVVGSPAGDGSIELDESDLVVTGLFDTRGRRVPWGRDGSGRLRIIVGASRRVLLGTCVLPARVAGRLGRIAVRLPTAPTRWVVVRGPQSAAVAAESRDVAELHDPAGLLAERWAELLRPVTDAEVGPDSGGDGDAQRRDAAADAQVQSAVRWLWQALAEDLWPTSVTLSGANRSQTAKADTGSLRQAPETEQAATGTADGRSDGRRPPLPAEVRVHSFFLPPHRPLALVMQPQAALPSRKARSPSAGPLLFYRHHATWSVRQTSIDVLADFSIEVVDGATADLRFAIPADLRIFGVRLGDTAISTWSVSSPGQRPQQATDAETAVSGAAGQGHAASAGVDRLLTIELPERLPDGKVLVRLEGTRPIALGGTRRLDCVRLVSGEGGETPAPVLVDGRIRLLVTPEVELGAWRMTGMRQVAPLEPFDDSLRTEFRMLSPFAVLELPVYLPRSRLTARQWTLVRARNDRLVADAFLEWSDSAERTFEVSCVIGKGWAVRSVRRLEATSDERFDWQWTAGGGRSLLQIVLPDALGERPERFHVHLTAQKADFELPPLRVRGGAVRDSLLGIASNGSDSLRFTADAALLERLNDGQAEAATEAIRRWLIRERSSSEPAKNVPASQPAAPASPSRPGQGDASPNGTTSGERESRASAGAVSQDVVRGPAPGGGSTEATNGATGDVSRDRPPSGTRADTETAREGAGPLPSTAVGDVNAAGRDRAGDRPPEPASPGGPELKAIEWWRFPAGEAWVAATWQRSRSAAVQAVIEAERGAGGWRATYRLQPQGRRPLPSRLYVAFTEPLPETARWEAGPDGGAVRARRISLTPSPMVALPPEGELWEVVIHGSPGARRVVTASASWPEFPERLPLAIVADDPGFVGYVTVRLPAGHRFRFETSGMYRLAGDAPAHLGPTESHATASPKPADQGRAGRFPLPRKLEKPWRGTDAVAYRWTYRTLEARLIARRPRAAKDAAIVADARWLAWLAAQWSDHDLHRIELRLSRPVSVLEVQLPEATELVGALLDGRSARLVRADGTRRDGVARGAAAGPPVAPGSAPRTGATRPPDAETSDGKAAEAARPEVRSDADEARGKQRSGGRWVLSLPDRPDRVFGTVELHLRSRVLERWLGREHRLCLPWFGSLHVRSVEVIARASPGTFVDGPPALWNEMAASGASRWWRRIGGPLVRGRDQAPFHPLRLDDWRRLAGVDVDRRLTTRLQHPLVGPFEDAWQTAVEERRGYCVAQSRPRLPTTPPQTAVEERRGYCVGSVATHAIVERPLVFRSVSNSFVRAVAWFLLLLLTLGGLAMRAVRFRARHAVAIVWAATACLCIGLVPDAYAEWAGSVTLSLVITVLCPRSVFRTVEPVSLSEAQALASTVAMQPGSSRATGVILRSLLWLGCVLAGVCCVCALAQTDGAGADAPGARGNGPARDTTRVPRGDAAVGTSRPSFDVLIPVERAAAPVADFRPANVVYLSDEVFRRLFSRQTVDVGDDVLFESADFVVSYDPELNVSAQARFAFSVRIGRPARLVLPLEGMNPLAETCRLDGEPVRLQADPQGRLFWQPEASSATSGAEPSGSAVEPAPSATDRSRGDAPAGASGIAWARHVLTVEIRPPLAPGDAPGQLTLPACAAGVTGVHIRSPRAIHAAVADAPMPVVWHPPSHPRAPVKGNLKAAIFCNGPEPPKTVRWFADVPPAGPELQVQSLDDYLVQPTYLDRTIVLSLSSAASFRADRGDMPAAPQAVQFAIPQRAVVRSVGLDDATGTHDVPFTLGTTAAGKRFLTVWLPAPSFGRASAATAGAASAGDGQGGAPEGGATSAPAQPTGRGAAPEASARRRIVCRLWQPYLRPRTGGGPQGGVGGHSVRVTPLDVKVFSGAEAVPAEVQSFATFGAEVPFRLVVSPESDAELRRVAAEELRLLFGDRASHSDTVFRVLNRAIVALDVVPVAGERRVSLAYLGQVDARELSWTIDATIDISGPAVYSHVIAVDEALQIDAISVVANDAEQLLRWTREGRQVVLHLRAPGTGRQTLTIRGRQPWKDGVPLALPVVHVRGASVEAARVRLLGAEDIQMRWADGASPDDRGVASSGARATVATAATRPVAELDLTGKQVAPQVVLQRRPAAPAAEVVIGLAVPNRDQDAFDPQAVPIDVTVAARVQARSMPQTLSWAIPEQLASGLQLEVTNGRAFGPTRSEQELRLDVIPEAGSDAVTVVMRSQFLLSPATRTLPLPRFLAGTVSRAYVLWDTDVAFSVEARLLSESEAPVAAEELAANDLPPWAAALPAIRRLLAGGHLLSTPEPIGAVTLEVPRTTAARPPVRDGVQWTWLYVNADGQVAAETQLFLIDPGPTWKLRWHPAAIELHAVEVDGNPVRPRPSAPDSSGEWTLPVGGEPSVIRVVRLVWSSRLARPLVSGPVRLPHVFSPDLPAERQVTLVAAAPGIVLRPGDASSRWLRSAAGDSTVAAASIASLWLDVARGARHAQARAFALEMAAMLLDVAERRAAGAGSAGRSERLDEGRAVSVDGPPVPARLAAEDATPVPPPMPVPPIEASAGDVRPSGTQRDHSLRLAQLRDALRALTGAATVPADGRAKELGSELLIAALARSTQWVALGEPHEAYYWTDLKTAANTLMFVVVVLAVGAGAVCRRLGLLERLHRWPGAMWLLLGGIWWAWFVPSVLGLLFVGFGIADLTRRLIALWIIRRRPVAEAPPGFTSSVVERFPGL